MKIKQIYIAASWKHRHAVEMLSRLLRDRGIEVVSFVDQAVKTEGEDLKKFDIENWIASEDGYSKFVFDTEGATKSDLLIYIGPSGTDAWAEVGAAWASNVPIFGLFAKGESIGLMRRMVLVWFDTVWQLLEVIDKEKAANCE